MAEVEFSVFRGGKFGGEQHVYRVPAVEGMVVLDAMHYIQAHIDGQPIVSAQDCYLFGKSRYQPLCFQRLRAQLKNERTHLGEPSFCECDYVL